MALIRQAFPEAKARGRVIGIWAMGGAVAAFSGPVLGGVLTALDWRLIFFINVPVGAIALLLLSRVCPSQPRLVSFDLIGQITGVLAMAGLTFGAIEAGAHGFGDPAVVVAFTVAVLALAGFVHAEQVVAHPMMPLPLFADRAVVITVVSGFAFMVGYFGLPFDISLFLQQHRGLDAGCCPRTHHCGCWPGSWCSSASAAQPIIAAGVLGATTVLAVFLPTTKERA